MLPSWQVLTSGGSESVDTAIKFASLYWHARGAKGDDKSLVVSREKSYHGSSIVSAAITGLPHLHHGFNSPMAQRMVRGAATLPPAMMMMIAVSRLVCLALPLDRFEPHARTIGGTASPGRARRRSRSVWWRRRKLSFSSTAQV